MILGAMVITINIPRRHDEIPTDLILKTVFINILSRPPALLRSVQTNDNHDDYQLDAGEHPLAVGHIQIRYTANTRSGLTDTDRTKIQYYKPKHYHILCSELLFRG